MAGVELVVGLDDNVSGPAKTASASLDRLERNIRSVENAARGGNTKIGMPSRALNNLDRVQKKTTEASKSNFGEAAMTGFMTSLSGAAMSAVMGAISAITNAIGQLVSGITTATVSAGLLREKASMAFGALSKDGAMNFDRIRKVALATGSTLENTFEGVRGFMLAGFGADDSERLFKRMQDLSAVGVSDDQRKRATVAMAQIRGAGMLQGDELNQLAEAGISRSRVIEGIAKQLNISNEEAAKKVAAGGQIKSDVALLAIEDAMSQMTGGGAAGTARAGVLDNTLQGSLERAKSLASIAFDDIAVAAAPAFAALSAAMKDIGASFDSPEMAKAKTLLAGVFSAIAPLVQVGLSWLGALGKGFLEVMGVGGATMTDDLKGMTKALQDPAFRDAMRGIGQGLGVMVMGAARAAKLFAQLAQAIAPISAAVWSLFDVAGWMQSLEAIPAWFESLPSRALGWGATLANALIDGITGGLSARLGEVSSMLQGAVSPSASLMAPSMAGGGSGFELPSLPSIGSLLGNSFAIPTVSSGGSGAPGSGGSPVTISQSFVVSGGPTAEEQWQAMRGRVRQEVQSVIRSVGGL